MRFASARLVEGSTGPGQDRAEVLDLGDRVLLVVADGAGGTSGGTEAAELALRLVVEGANDLRASGPAWFGLFANVDHAIASSPHGGETTLVVAVVDDDGVHGMSVGDSGAWLIGPTGFVDLTRSQHRKPLLGSGAAAVPFSHSMTSETLLVASDGLLKYAKPNTLCSMTRKTDLGVGVRELLDAVRLRSGALQDDIAVLLGRRL